MKAKRLISTRAAKATLVAGAVLAGAMGTGVAANAQPVKKSESAVIAAGHEDVARRTVHIYKYKNIKYLGRTCGKKRVGEDRGPGPMDLTLTGSTSVSNTVSSQFGVDIKELSVSVGYDVTKTRTMTMSGTFHVPRGKRGYLWAHPLYEVRSYKAYLKIGGGRAPFADGKSYKAVGLCYDHQVKPL